MSSLRNVFGVCVSDRSVENERQEKLRFGVPLAIALKNGSLPAPLLDLLMYITEKGVTTVDIFRRAGNPTNAQRIMKRMSEGKSVTFSDYNFYTLSSVVKKFLLKIPGGILGVDGERHLLSMLDLPTDHEQIAGIHRYLSSLHDAHQRLLFLLFNTWSCIVNNSAINCMNAEALAISVAGSVFHTCSDDPVKIDRAGKVIQLIIRKYQSRSDVDLYNADQPIECRQINHDVPLHSSPSSKQDSGLDENMKATDRIEDELKLPSTVTSGSISEGGSIVDTSDQQSDINISIVSVPVLSTIPSPTAIKRARSLEDQLCEKDTSYVYQTYTLNRFNSVKRRQLVRLRQRSDWFLGSESISPSSKTARRQHIDYRSASLDTDDSLNTRSFHHPRPLSKPSVLNERLNVSIDSEYSFDGILSTSESFNYMDHFHIPQSTNRISELSLLDTDVSPSDDSRYLNKMYSIDENSDLQFEHSTEISLAS